MKVTLRELFLFVLVIALALGWWLDRSRLSAKSVASEKQLQTELRSKKALEKAFADCQRENQR